MEVTLTRFVHALRSAELPVSPAETLDGYAVVQKIGIADPKLLENALALVLAKTIDEKARFAECFQRFFHQLAFQQPAKRSMLRSIEPQALLDSVSGTGNETLTDVISAIVREERDAVAWRVQVEAQRLQLDQLQTLRDKSRYVNAIARTLGVEDLERLITAAESVPEDQIGALRYLRQYINEQVREYVDAQYALTVDASGKRALLEAALKSNLNQLQPDYYGEVDRVVAKLADKLAQQHRRRRRKARRGVLDLKHTIRENVAYDGALFDLRWRSKRKSRSRVFTLSVMSVTPWPASRGFCFCFCTALLKFCHRCARSLFPIAAGRSPSSSRPAVWRRRWRALYSIGAKAQPITEELCWISGK